MFIFAAIAVSLMFLLPGGRADQHSYKTTHTAPPDSNKETSVAEPAPSLIDTLSS
jgi:hypothetical protein